MAVSKRVKLIRIRWDESTILTALTKRYPDPEWAFFPQVRNGTGYRGQGPTRTADAVAMNLWPSRGMEVHGFEIKSSRSDFLSELKNPEKADPIAKYCDKWYLVLGNKDTVLEGELPAAWGLLCMYGDQLKCEKEAPKLDPVPLDRTFVAAILRNQARCPNQELQDRFKDGFDEGKRANEYSLRELQKTVKAFEDASGVSIEEEWTAGSVGRAVKALIKMRFDVEHIRKSADNAQAIADALRSMIDSSGLGPMADEVSP